MKTNVLRVLTLLALGVVGALTSGCALRSQEAGRRSVSSSSDVQHQDSLEDHIERVRHLSARPVAKSSSLPRIEQQDRWLAAALLRLSVAETGEHLRAVAERYRMLGVPDQAYQYFSRALALDARDGAAHDGLARVWRDWGLPGLALGDAHRALFFAPTSAAAHNTMGTILQALGQHAEARKLYERASGLDPRAVYALSNLCYLSFLHGDFDRALTTCQSALAIDPRYAAARNNLALTHAAAGRLDVARTEFMDAGDESVGYFNIGIVHMAARDYTLAVEAFDAASRRDPMMAAARSRAQEARQLGRRPARDATGDPK